MERGLAFFGWRRRTSFDRITVTMSKATETAVKMIESLPEAAQDRVVEELRALVEDARDEAKWDDLIERKKGALRAAARKACQEIAAGKATDMDFDKL